MKTTINTKSLVLLGLLTALTLIFSFTPLGTIPIGPLSITLNIIPIALAAVVMGPIGGLIMGAIFGILSFLQCIGIGVPSAMGATLFNINPILAFVQRFVPRALDGLLVGWLYKGLSFGGKNVRFEFTGIHKMRNKYIPCAIAGFCSALFNTILFMLALVLLFNNTEYLQGLIGNKNIIVFICTFVGINAVCEMIVSTIITGAVGSALYKARLISSDL